jgi:hypothetical protein
MAFRINNASRSAAVTALVNTITVLEIRTGTQPATAETAASGTLLATITGISWGTASNGVISVTGTPNVTAVATGTAGWGRFRNTGDTLRFDGAVGAEFTLADTSIVSGGTVTLTSASVTQPAS